MGKIVASQGNIADSEEHSLGPLGRKFLSHSFATCLPLLTLTIFEIGDLLRTCSGWEHNDL